MTIDGNEFTVSVDENDFGDSVKNHGELGLHQQTFNLENRRAILSFTEWSERHAALLKHEFQRWFEQKSRHIANVG